MSHITPGGGVFVAGTPTDGQHLAWNATLGVWQPTNPTGTSELAYASNVTGTITSVTTGTSVDIPGCSITVPISTRPVWLEGSAWFQQVAAETSPKTAQVSLYLYETTSGSTLITNWMSTQALFTVGVGKYTYALGRFRLGAVASARSFKVGGAIVRDTGGTATFQALNSTSAPSYLTALAF